MKEHACTQDGCTVAIDGHCLEGLAPDECPYHQWLDISDEIHAEESVEPDPIPEPPGMVFEAGDYLNASGARELTCRTVSKVVVLAGEVRSGKTAVLASLMEAFHKGPFAGFVFAGSRTLPGFDQICHHARMASGRTTAFTPRTARSEDMRFLHLDLAEEADLSTHHTLLLSDISGEAFEAARMSVDEARLLGHISRADHVLVLVDGRKLLNPAERHTTGVHALSLIRNLLDAEVLGQESFLDIVISKWDLLEAAGSSVHAQISLLERDATVRFEARVGRLRFRRIAAQPPAGAAVPVRFGLAELLRDWVTLSPRQIRRIYIPPALPPAVRQFARFPG